MLLVNYQTSQTNSKVKNELDLKKKKSSLLFLSYPFIDYYY